APASKDGQRASEGASGASKENGEGLDFADIAAAPEPSSDDPPAPGSDRGSDDGKGLDFADMAADRAQGKLPSLRIVELPERDIAEILEREVKKRPNGPFTNDTIEKFERLRREQPEAFARLCERYPALAAAVRLDAAAVRAVLENASKDKVVELFIDLVLAADLNTVGIDAL